MRSEVRGDALARLRRLDDLVDEARRGGDDDGQVLGLVGRRERGGVAAGQRARGGAVISIACVAPMTPILALGQAKVRSCPRSRQFMTMCAPPYACLRVTVTRGTVETANARSRLAPRRSTASRSWRTPGRKPGVSASTTSGSPKRLAKSTNHVPLSAASASSVPPR